MQAFDGLCLESRVKIASQQVHHSLLCHKNQGIARPIAAQVICLQVVPQSRTLWNARQEAPPTPPGLTPSHANGAFTF